MLASSHPQLVNSSTRLALFPQLVSLRALPRLGVGTAWKCRGFLSCLGFDFFNKSKAEQKPQRRSFESQRLQGEDLHSAGWDRAQSPHSSRAIAVSGSSRPQRTRLGTRSRGRCIRYERETCEHGVPGCRALVSQTLPWIGWNHVTEKRLELRNWSELVLTTALSVAQRSTHRGLLRPWRLMKTYLYFCPARRFLCVCFVTIILDFAVCSVITENKEHYCRPTANNKIRYFWVFLFIYATFYFYSTIFVWQLYLLFTFPSPSCPVKSMII